MVQLLVHILLLLQPDQLLHDPGDLCCVHGPATAGAWSCTRTHQTCVLCARTCSSRRSVIHTYTSDLPHHLSANPCSGLKPQPIAEMLGMSTWWGARPVPELCAQICDSSCLVIHTHTSDLRAVCTDLRQPALGHTYIHTHQACVLCARSCDSRRSVMHMYRSDLHAVGTDLQQSMLGQAPAHIRAAR